VKKEVGSSIMPQKVNPIMFENSEGNLLIANAVLEFLANELQTSRLQRDLTDSTLKRNYGLGFAYSIIGLKSCLEGLNRVEANKEKMLNDLKETPEVLAEAIQTVMRKNQVKDAYEKLKNFSRGKRLSLKEIREFISKQKISKEDKERLLKLEPKDYFGEAVQLVELGLKELKE
jgi:adenylosuccinate lyase